MQFMEIVNALKDIFVLFCTINHFATILLLFSRLQRKQQNKLYFPGRLGSFNVCSRLLEMLYWFAIASVLYICIVQREQH